METGKEKNRFIPQFICDKGENTSQAAENVNSVYSADTVTVNQAEFWFRRYRSSRSIGENVDNIMEIVESGRHANIVSTA